MGDLQGRVARALEAWTRQVRRFSVSVVVAGAIATVAAGWYAGANLGIDTDTQDLFPSRLEWRGLMDRYLDAYPHAGHSLLVVVDGATPEAADAAQRRLAEELDRRDDLFATVYAPGAEDFFRTNGLLFRSVDELEDLVDRVSRFAPWLRSLEGSPTLPTFAAVLDSTLEAERYRDELDVGPLVGMVGRAFEAAADRRPFRVSWAAVLDGERPDGGDARRFLTVRPRLDYSRGRPGKPALAAVRSLVGEQGWESDPSVEVRLTGRVAMQDEEIESVSRGAAVAGILAFLLVGVVLFVGLRSTRLIVASLATLLAGLAATAAFAALVVGRLNLISVAFGVLYIGLGIDYAVHLGLRYRELRHDDVEHGPAVERALADVGPSLLLSAVTTALAFYAFVPTDFTGISELGVISGSGMVISLVATVTLMPALLEVAARGPKAWEPAGGGGGLGSSALVRLPEEHPRAIGYAALALVAVSLFFAPRARFDANPLNLRDPDAESVATYVELLRGGGTSPLTISLLRSSPADAREAARRAATLETVASTRTLDDFVPPRQEEKLRLLEEVRTRLGPPPEGGSLAADDTSGSSPVPSGGPDAATPGPDPGGPASARDEPLSPARGMEAVERIRSALLGFRPFADEQVRRRVDYALFQITRWRQVVEEWPSEGQGPFVRELETRLLGWLPSQIRQLRAGLATTGVTRADLPDELVRRWVSPEGVHRVELVPEESLEGAEALERFVEGVRAEFPDATGPPVTRQMAGEVAVASFRQALLLAVGSMSILLLLALGSFRSAVAVMVPLLLAGVVTVAASVVLGAPFNFANLIALPLLLGVGLDNGVHMVHRSRSATPGRRLLQTSTARAVVVSFCTTIFSFGNLAFSPHRGMASMGRHLTVAMTAALLTTLLVLPVLLEGRRGGPAAAGGDAGGDGGRPGG